VDSQENSNGYTESLHILSKLEDAGVQTCPFVERVTDQWSIRPRAAQSDFKRCKSVPGDTDKPFWGGSIMCGQKILSDNESGHLRRPSAELVWREA
jgi:hypothetical protein